jgi:DNA-directed RNA polymerase specialized sigma24 family protein
MKIPDLSQEAFFRLLTRLNADPLLAGEEYEKLRARLMYFFERKGCRISAELSDETINRVARRIGEGLEIEDVFKFSYGVARLVLLEHWNDPKREWDQLDDRLSSPKTDRELDDYRLECMEKCLRALPPEERDLIVKNCSRDKKGKEDLARSLELTINALRIRVFRIRTKLNECREKCLRGGMDRRPDLDRRGPIK